MSGSSHSRNIKDWKLFLIESKEKFKEKYAQNLKSDFQLEDFKILSTIGKGSYGTVVVAMGLDDRYYAIKILEKKHLLKKSQISQSLSEKRMLSAISFPFVVHMEHFFMDSTYLYFVMPFSSGGDMFTKLKRCRKFSEAIAAFFGAQIVLAFEFLHNLNVVYRDLKPENILLERDGYVKLTDLGFAKLIERRTYTVCGTPDYIAPEVIQTKGYGFPVDWWGLGVLLYEMSAGVPPFYAKDTADTYQLILKRRLRLPPGFSSRLCDVVDRLLQLEVSKRLGSMKNGVEDIKTHGWFHDIIWMDVLNKKMKAPMIPVVSGPGDSTNFDKYSDFTPRVLSEDVYKDEFKEF